MHTTCNNVLSIILTKRIKRSLYLEKRLMNKGMIEIPRFEAYFRHYIFQWMTTPPNKYSPTSVQDFYMVYKDEMQRQYPHKQLWRGGDPITLLIIWRVLINISPLTTSNFQCPSSSLVCTTLTHLYKSNISYFDNDLTSHVGRGYENIGHIEGQYLEHGRRM